MFLSTCARPCYRSTGHGKRPYTIAFIGAVSSLSCILREPLLTHVRLLSRSGAGRSVLLTLSIKRDLCPCVSPHQGRRSPIQQVRTGGAFLTKSQAAPVTRNGARKAQDPHRPSPAYSRRSSMCDREKQRRLAVHRNGMSWLNL